MRVEAASYSVEEGLSDRDVWGLAKDRMGYFWIATTRGLNRFDGYGFLCIDNGLLGRFHYVDPELLMDRQGCFLFPARQPGISYRVNPATGSIDELPLNERTGWKGTFAGQCRDASGEVFFLGLEGGTLAVFRFIPESVRFEPVFQTALDSNPEGYFPAISAACISDGSFWFYYLNEKGQSVILHVTRDGKRLHALGESVFVPQPGKPSRGRILQGPDGRIWVTKATGVYAGDANNPSAFRMIPELSNGTFMLSSDEAGNVLAVEVAYKGKQTRVFLFAKDGNVYDYSWIYNDETFVPQVRSNATETYGFNNFTSAFLFKSNDGIRKIRLSTAAFSQYLAQIPGTNKPGISVRGIEKLGPDRLLVASEFNGLFSIDLRTGATDDMLAGYTVTPQGATVSLPRNLLARGDSVVWIPEQRGIWKIQPSRRTARRIEGVSGLINAAFDPSGRIWTASTSGQFALMFDPRTEKFEPYSDADGNNPVANSNPMYVYADRSGTVWVGTKDKGLVRIDPGKRQSAVFNKSNGFKSNNVSCILEAGQGKLWVGTLNGGLHLFDPAAGRVEAVYNRTNGLPNNSIASILDDGKGMYWISTFNGLVRFDPVKKTFHSYFTSNGLSHNEFNRYSSFLDPSNGKLYFGGLNGLNGFFQKDLSNERNEAALLVPELTYAGASDSAVVQNWGIHDGYTVTIPPGNAFLYLRLALAHYDNPQGNQFAYWLEGLDDGWISLGTNRDLRFNHLPAGTYKLHLRGADSQGNLSSKELTITVEVLEFWYKRWWAWLLYALLLGAGGYAFYRFRLERRLAEREAQRLQELDAFKSQFYTNITHEFRTPLTVILGNADSLAADLGKANASGLASRATMIKRSGENLLRLINEILDLAKLENNSLALNYVHADVLPFLRYIAESMHSLANARNVMLRVESNESSIPMDYDQDRLLQIVHNLLSNAIKFTPSGGKVVLSAKVADKPAASEKQLHLSVSDTGKGIPEDDLPHVFDRFFQAKNQGENKAGGTGIGLSLTKELVKVMDGTITVESKEGVGSTFTVCLPLRTGNAEREMGNAAWEMRNGERRAEDAEWGTQHADHDNAAFPVAQSPFVLLLEDNPDVVEYLTTCLSDRYRLDFAYNGRAGIEKAFANLPDLIISDVMMPEQDGFEVCDILKNDDRTSHVPFILLTARADVASRIAGLRRGADVYLSKPFHREELLAHVENLLEVRRKLQLKYSDMLLERGVSGPDTDVPNQEAAFVLKLRELIETHLADPKLSPEFIGQKMGMSRTNLHRKVTALTGLPITLFVRNLRLQKARELLQTTALNVSEVAFAVGFDDPKYFSRVFSETFGMPPSAVREG